MFGYFLDFADALSNPIAYQSKLEKHAEQLAVLEEDFDVEVGIVFFLWLLYSFWKSSVC